MCETESEKKKDPKERVRGEGVSAAGSEEAALASTELQMSIIDGGEVTENPLSAGLERTSGSRLRKPGR